MKLKIEYVPIESIEPYANNAKLHPAEQVEQIKKSIQEFGFNDPIAVAATLVEVIVGICDTPFLYIAQKIKG